MMQKFLKVLLFCSLGFQLACAVKSQSQKLNERLIELKSKISENSSEQLVQKGESAVEIFDQAGMLEAEDLANSGLSSLTFDSFDESLMFFEMALTKDRGNEKALFYLSMLRPLRPLKGLHWRLKDTSSYEDSNKGERWVQEKNMFNYLQSAFNNPNDNLIRYFLTPYKNQIDNPRVAIKEIVEPFLDELAHSFEDLEILISNPEIDFQVNLPVAVPIWQNARIRNGDLRVIQGYYRALYLTYRMMAAYSTTGIEISALNKMSNQEKLSLNLSDPAFGLLTDPNFFKILRSDFLGLAESLDEAINNLKERFINNENDPHDIYQINGRTFLMCSPQIPFNSMNLPLGSTEADRKSSDTTQTMTLKLTCDFPSEVQTKLMLTVRESHNRDYFDQSYDGQYLIRQKEISDYDNFSKKEDDVDSVIESLEKIKNFLLGPSEFESTCLDANGQKVIEKYWVDFPKFSEKPIYDLKSLKPKFLGNLNMEEIYFLEDPTFGGLYNPTVPCYQFNQERARKLGKLSL